MKTLIIFLLTSLVFTQTDFSEKRKKCVQGLRNFVEDPDVIKERQSYDKSSLNYISGVNQTVKIHIKSFQMYELDSRLLDPIIYELLRGTVLTSEANAVKKIYLKPESNHTIMVEYFGAGIRTETAIFYYIIETNIIPLYKNGFEKIEYEECKKTYWSTRYVKKTKLIPKDVPEEMVSEVEKYLLLQSLNLIKKKLLQLESFEGKVLMSFTPEELTRTIYAVQVPTYAILHKDATFEVVTNYERVSLSNCPKGITIGYKREGLKDLETSLAAFITEDGFIQCKYENTLLWQYKFFEPSQGVQPYKLYITQDANFVVLDDKNKLIGQIRKDERLTDTDFVLPDSYSLYNRKYKARCLFMSMIWMLRNLQTFPNVNERTEWISYIYKVVIGEGSHFNEATYTVVKKDGRIQLLKFINEETEILWEPDVNVKGNGPYSLRVTEYPKIEAINGDGEVYWDSDSIPNKKNKF